MKNKIKDIWKNNKKMQVSVLYIHYHRKDDIPITHQYICTDSKFAENIIDEMRKPHYKHADEIIKLYEQNEIGYLLRTVKFPSTLEFLNGPDLNECQNEEDIVNEIIRYEVFNFEIKEKTLDLNSNVLMSDKCSLY